MKPKWPLEGSLEGQVESKRRLEGSLEGKMEFKWHLEASLKAKLASKWLLEASWKAQVVSKMRFGSPNGGQVAFVRHCQRDFWRSGTLQKVTLEGQVEPKWRLEPSSEGQVESKMRFGRPSGDQVAPLRH